MPWLHGVIIIRKILNSTDSSKQLDFCRKIMPNTTTLKGLPMKYKHFDDIEQNNKTDFIMLYFAVCRNKAHSYPPHKTGITIRVSATNFLYL